MFSIEWNAKAWERELSDVANRQLPFAMMLTINDALKDIETNTIKALDRKFDRPTPFTKRGVYVKRATKRRLIGEVGFKPIQAKYLGLNITGGIRLPKRNAIIMPVAQRVNKYGNLPRGSVKRAGARKDTFKASRNDPRTRHLAPGIYMRGNAGKRRGGGYGTKGNNYQGKGKARSTISMLVSFKDRAAYRKRYDFVGGAAKTADNVLPRHFVRNMRRSMATAR